ncbi:hypothetical protein QT381_12535 [Galbitalea sp. SE-J8]|uniref:hypothetical protein n=1 Tax=Galbitalea sp. SE-J8 TaxID=3054952 RepID=UPI00259CD7D1|nr:hypothetical protein [Galbitalea sp. SE-J8]MDM4763835.1 hypothetical protein [Galbitalea sp. SE-J8]
MVTRYEAAIRLDITPEQAARHGLPKQLTDADLAAIEADPPAWLVQSRANRGAKPVWVGLTCALCGFGETVRPKKWWSEATYLVCDDHDLGALPEPAPGRTRRLEYGIGSRFVAVVDEP